MMREPIALVRRIVFAYDASLPHPVRALLPRSSRGRRNGAFASSSLLLPRKGSAPVPRKCGEREGGAPPSPALFAREKVPERSEGG